MKQCIALLGSTGSIGTQTLDVAKRLGIRVCALAAHSNVQALERQARAFCPQLVCLYEEKAAKDLRARIADTGIKVLTGMDGLCEVACLSKADLTVNAVVGMVGLKPTLAAIAAGKDVALANKETLVAGGALVMDAVRLRGTHLIPVDSEHSAIFQCLQTAPHKALKKILLTASGGPFFGKSKPELESVTPQQALQHPNWHMGAKITVDSATMMNKGLEVMEAGWLFGASLQQIEVLVHRQSLVHSMVEFVDNSIIAQLGVPDMRLPIQYALTYPQRLQSPVPELDLFAAGPLTFAKPDADTFSCFAACKRAMERGGLAPAAVNGANEAAVHLFLEQKISFTRIGELVMQAMQAQPAAPVSSLDRILEADAAAREYVFAHA